MKRFIVHATLFALAQVAFLSWAWQHCPDDPDHYMAATSDKHARLRSANDPRVIFVGGSSVAFSVDSRAFEPLGLNPVNMGLTVDLGLGFMLGEVEGQLREGDVVVVAPEPRLFWSGSNDDAIWAAIQRRPASIACLAAAGPRAVANVFDQALHFFARKLRCAAHQMTTDRDLPTMFRRASFDARGDFVAHRNKVPTARGSNGRPWPGPERIDVNRSIEQLATFAARCEAVGAHCFMAWCPMREARVASERATYELLERRLQEVGMPLLETVAEAGYPEREFYDPGPHLTGPAGARRSSRLARRLAAALGLEHRSRPRETN